tara:strand:+ start:27103 stop:27420 length:318 start_codon:yes stop_codon:yes gene_type:complete
MSYTVNILTTNETLVKIPFKSYEYPNLMELIINTYYEDIGECLGRGLCGTCHVKIIKGVLENTSETSEKTTLSKIYNVDTNSRLACQIMLNSKINNLTFKIITES